MRRPGDAAAPGGGVEADCGCGQRPRFWTSAKGWEQDVVKSETHIDRECQLLGHEFAYEPEEEPGEGPMHCIHCGVAQ